MNKKKTSHYNICFFAENCDQIMTLSVYFISISITLTADSQMKIIDNMFYITVNVDDNESSERQTNSQSVVVNGLESGTVIGIAFAAFFIGVLLMAALWFIHTHTGL